MNKVRLALVILLMLMGILTSGCMQVFQKVKVEPDGSGMMVETLKLSPMVMEMIKEFVQGTMDLAEEKPGQKKVSQENLFPEQQFKEKAKQMGEGVEFVSREVKQFEEGMVGYVVSYRISNIDKFTLNSREEEPTMLGTNTPITFCFSRGMRSSSLKIEQHFVEGEKKMEEEIKTETQEEELTPADKEQLAQLMEMVKGMRMQIVIECGQEIEATNADWWEKNRIILVDFDAEQLFSHPDRLKMLSQGEQPKTKEDFEKLLQGIEGIKFDLKEEIKVKFR